GVDGHVFPLGVELRPLCYVVDVFGDCFGRECPELFLFSAYWLRTALDRERPLVERRVRRRAGRKHREVVSYVLVRRQTTAVVTAPAAPKPTRDDPHATNLHPTAGVRPLRGQTEMLS